MLFNSVMKAKEMDLKFQEGLRLWNAGKAQECADIWQDLADHGHLDSIEQLAYVFLGQKEFEEVARLIDCAEDPNDPTILYLKARKIEEEIGIDATVYNSVTKKFDTPVLESFRIAADAGNPNACFVLFDVYIEKQHTEGAKLYLLRLAEHADYLQTHSTSYEELRASLEKVIAEVYCDPTSMGNDVSKGLASNPVCPEEILTRLAKDPDPEVRAAVAENSLTPPEILKILAKDKSREVRERVAGNTSTPVETLDVMAKVSYLRELIAENPSISMTLLKELSVNRNEDVRRAVAQNPTTPPEILVLLAKDTEYSVRHNVAYNRTTPAEALVILAKEAGYMIRAGVARDRNTPPELLEELASDDIAEVRFSVAANPSAPLDLIFRMNLLKSSAAEGDEYGFGRASLAKNPDTPVEILELFSKDKDYRVRCGVAENPSTPIEILKELANEKTVNEDNLYSQLVLDGVAKNPSIPTSLRKEIIEVLINDDLSPWIRRDVARNELAPADVLRSLAKDKWADVRRVVAGNPVTPIEILNSLAEDDHSSVRAAVAENPRTPEDILRKLAILDTL